MFILYGIIFFLLIILSAFFSSAETSILSLNKIKLDLRAKKKHKRSQLLQKFLGNPEDFFSTILIGNNLVNIAAATISTIFFTEIFISNKEMILLTSTLVTTIIILIFSEIIPKSIAFRFNEKLANIYAYPLKFFGYLFYPFIKAASFITNSLLNKIKTDREHTALTPEEIKHFLSSEITLFKYNPHGLKMITQIIDISKKDVKSLMTPRVNIIALEESLPAAEINQIIIKKKHLKYPVYETKLDNIIGTVETNDILFSFLNNSGRKVFLRELLKKPVFLSEYSSLNYALNQFRKHRQNMAIILDEYGATVGILTINDIFRGILGNIEISKNPVQKITQNIYIIKGNTPVYEVNQTIDAELSEGKDYTTISGLFIYNYGKIPEPGHSIRANNCLLTVKKMEKRRINEIKLEKLY